VYMMAIIPADFVMSRQMLRGVKTRAERMAPADRAAPISSRKVCIK
jgi:hypothetical protein